jgi:hypothetical protein
MFAHVTSVICCTELMCESTPLVLLRQERPSNEMHAGRQTWCVRCVCIKRSLSLVARADESGTTVYEGSRTAKKGCAVTHGGNRPQRHRPKNMAARKLCVARAWKRLGVMHRDGMSQPNQMHDATNAVSDRLLHQAHADRAARAPESSAHARGVMLRNSVYLGMVTQQHAVVACGRAGRRKPPQAEHYHSRSTCQQVRSCRP